MVVGDQRRAPAVSSPGRENRYPLYTRLEEPQGRSEREQKISRSPGFDPRIVRPVASRYTDWAISAHNRRTVVPYNQRSSAPHQTRPPTSGVLFVNCVYRRLGGNYGFISNLKPCKTKLMFTGFWKYKISFQGCIHGRRDTQWVEALWYKSVGSGFDSCRPH